jgi:hypothetical protein
MQKLPIIGEVDFNEVKPLDTVYIGYGFDYVRAIIKKVLPTGIVFTTPSCMKSENMFQSFYHMRNFYTNKPPFYGKRYSKFRWFFKF